MADNSNENIEKNMNNKKLVNDPTIKFKGPFSGILFSIFSVFLFIGLSATIRFLLIENLNKCYSFFK